MGYHLTNVDYRGHLANFHLPNFVHVVIEQPLSVLCFEHCLDHEHRNYNTIVGGKEENLTFLSSYFIRNNISSLVKAHST